jgi:transcriptional regulator with XRE-family HTH domain
MDLGNAIKQLRKQKNYNQKQFCKIVGITHNYLSLIESSKREPSIKVLKKIADELETPFAVLFWFTLDSTDVEPRKLEMFELLKPSIDKLITELFN